MGTLRLLTAIMLVAGGASAETYDELISRAASFYEQGEYLESGESFEAAFAVEKGRPAHYYNAACSWSLAGHPDKAFAMLDRAIEEGFRDAELMTGDSDLEALHGDPRWDPAVSRCRGAEAAYLLSINVELYRLFQEDQADRRGEVEWEEVSVRDEERRAAVAKMIEEDQLHAVDDFVHAAFIFQHGADSTAYRAANELAMRAVALDSTSVGARWIAAASMDRYLQSVGRPQIYGTQLLMRNGKWTLEPYDTTVVSDAERARWGVPPLSRQRAWEAEMNRPEREGRREE
jgi:tetratricopeptide (TPR) repeat protein